MKATLSNKTLRSSFGILLPLSLGLALGCDGDSDVAPTPTSPEATSSSLATVDGTPIPAHAVDLPLQLDLHDLDHARYQRRLDQLRLLISEQLGPDVSPDSAEWNQRVEIQLEPPPPPRLEIPDGSAPMRGHEIAPITIVEFVDFESAHCRRLQPELVRILERYPDHVRLLARDLPLPYHRYAWDAAYAAHCAAEQDAYWAYHDVLLFEQPKLALPDLNRYAARLELDSRRFETCVQSGRYSSQITADVALAAELGVRRAATLFVNGLYLTGRPSYAEIDRVVRSELARLGFDVSSPPEAPAAPARSPQSETRAIPLQARSDERPALPEVPADFLDDPEAIITLSRSEVDRALRERQRLNRKLEASSGEFSGQRLLKIRKTDSNDFYARLGLQERDVLMIVNGEFLTVENNTLWEAFETGDRVTILVMRRGLPHTFEYRIR
jgi:protein-disulfide isomerase